MTRVFAGLDVADRTTQVCVVDGAGHTVFECVTDTEPVALITALKPFKRVLGAVGLEAGNKSAWLYKGLAAKKFPVYCLDPLQTHAALSARRNKSDKNDANGMALLMCRGIFAATYVKSYEAMRTRTLLVHRKALQRKAIDVFAALCMTLKAFGASVDTSGKTPKIVMAKRDAQIVALAHAMLRAHASLRAEYLLLDSIVRKQVAADPVCRRLMTVPGVGPITALTFRAAVDEPTRFRSSRNVAAHFGLTPRRFQSGEHDVMGSISKRGDIAVRAALYSAASSLITISKSKAPLRLWARELAERKSYKVAVVACARKLAVIMHRMWVTGRDFDPTPTYRSVGGKRPP